MSLGITPPAHRATAWVYEASELGATDHRDDADPRGCVDSHCALGRPGAFGGRRLAVREDPHVWFGAGGDGFGRRVPAVLSKSFITVFSCCRGKLATPPDLRARLFLPLLATPSATRA